MNMLNRNVVISGSASWTKVSLEKFKMNCNYCYSFEQIYSSQNVYNEYVNSIATRLLDP